MCRSALTLYTRSLASAQPLHWVTHHGMRWSAPGWAFGEHVELGEVSLQRPELRCHRRRSSSYDGAGVGAALRSQLGRALKVWQQCQYEPCLTTHRQLVLQAMLPRFVDIANISQQSTMMQFTLQQQYNKNGRGKAMCDAKQLYTA